jgi:8-amino-7-oxononanoate synthase
VNHLPISIQKALIERQQTGTLRTLKNSWPGIDFCSNDYLGFSKTNLLSEKLRDEDVSTDNFFGATGSRLISGNSQFVEDAEKQIALFHHAQSALIFNSGYDANLGILSSVPQKSDLILYDENIHASIYDGIRLSSATHYKFRHNDIDSLEELINRHHKNFENIYVVIESVYSLDGDTAPLLELSEMCKASKNIFLIVDEAHAIGVFGNQGRGLCNAMAVEHLCFARIYTYGKAMGCQGAAIVGSQSLRNYLINFARSFIYTTALPNHCINAIRHSYQLLIETKQKDLLQNNISYFYSKAANIKNCIKSQSAIHSMLVGSNAGVDELEHQFAEKDIHVRPMKSPTVKPGSERVRICIHAFNTKSEIDLLVDTLNQFK